MTNAQSPIDALSRAKVTLVLSYPFFATLVCGMPVVIDDTLDPPTMATDGTKIMAHPAWVMNHTPHERVWALCHETMHCVFKHFLPTNYGSRNFKKWNVAADVVINVMLESQSDPASRVGQRPKGVIWEASEMLGGRTAVDLYKAGGGTTQGVYALLPDFAGDGDTWGDMWDRFEPMKGDPSKQATAEAQWNVKVAQAAAVAKAQGKLSQEMKRFVGEALKPRVNWQEKMRHFFTQRVRSEQTYARPNRRFMSQGMYLPGRSGSKLGEVAVAVDLSGSVNEQEFKEFAAELRAIKTDCMPANLHVLYFTIQVEHHAQFAADEELELTPNWSGGTAFSPIMRYIEDHDIDPVALVVLTDLYCSDFGDVPPYPVMWVSTGADKVPWGDVVMLREQGLTGLRH